jgi:phosphatidylglycerol---prolipoprotein diacylglyceryl transferase
LLPFIPFFGFSVDSYGLANVLAYGVAAGLTYYLALKDGREKRDAFDFILFVVVAALFGAKIFHTLFEAQGHQLSDGTVADGLLALLADDPLHWADLFSPGYVFYGGVVIASFSGMYFVYSRQFTDPAAFADYAAPALALGMGIGRTGCFLAGCCYGVGTDLPWAVHYPSGDLAALGAVHPVQIYDAMFGFVAFLVILTLYERRRFSGQLFLGLVGLYTFWRFGTEMLRADDDRGIWLSLSTSQWVSVLALPMIIVIWKRWGAQYPREQHVS